MQKVAKWIQQYEPDHAKSPLLHTAFDAFFTFAFTPNKTTTAEGVQIRDGMDLKRLMVHVVLALQLAYLFGTYNIGHQHFVALGEYTGFIEGFHLKLAYGLVKLIPIFVVTHLVGLGIEFYYAARKGHAVEEGFLVSGALIPLIMPPDIPLWILALAVAFAVVIGKEAFGGTGMNILNIALLARVFVFFAYPTYISGDDVWIAGIEKDVVTATYHAADYGWVFGLFDGLFGAMGLAEFGSGGQVVADSYTGATPLALAAKGGWNAVTEVYSPAQMIWGDIPGSIGESSKPLLIIGALLLVFGKIADYRLMLGVVIGAAFAAILFNWWGATPFMTVPWYNHFIMGSLVFALIYMATDPVTASSTFTGKWIYAFGIGAIGMVVRVLNPAYPEGWMLSILFMNVFAPLIDYYVVQANIKRRLKRATKLSPAMVEAIENPAAPATTA